MQLLQRRPVQTEIDKRVSLESRLDASVNKKITEFNAFKTIMAERRDKIEQDFINFCLETENRRNELANEIATLEARREQALLPIKTEFEELERAKLAQRELIREADDKIAEQHQISERNAKIAKSINKKEAEINKLMVETESLNKNAWDMVSKRLQDERELANLKSTLELRYQEAIREITEEKKKIANKERSLNVLLEENKARAKEFEKRERRIESRQAQIKNALEQLKYESNRRK